MDVKDVFPAKAKMLFKVNCAFCKIVVSDHTPGYIMRELSICTSCEDILCDACMAKQNAPSRNDCTPKVLI